MAHEIDQGKIIGSMHLDNNIHAQVREGGEGGSTFACQEYGGLWQVDGRGQLLKGGLGTGASA